MDKIIALFIVFSCLCLCYGDAGKRNEEKDYLPGYSLKEAEMEYRGKLKTLIRF